MHPYLQKRKNSKTPISFQYFGNIPSVTCSQIPFLCIYYNVTLFIFEYVHKIFPDPPLVINPPLCIPYPCDTGKCSVLLSKFSIFLQMNVPDLVWRIYAKRRNKRGIISYEVSNQRISRYKIWSAIMLLSIYFKFISVDQYCHLSLW